MAARCCRRKFSFNLITVEPGLFCYMLAYFLFMPTFQAFVYNKVCLDKYNETLCGSLRNKTFQEDHKTEEDFVQSETSYWILKKNIVDQVPSCLIVVFILGSFGDKVGRKLPAILPSVGATLSSLVCLLMSIYPSSKVEYVMIAGAVNGLSGGFSGQLMAVYSYVTHVADPANRTMRLGFIEAVNFLAGTFGVFISGVMLDNTSFIFVFAFTAGCSFLGLVYAIIRLENLTASTSRPEGESFCEYWFLGSLKESGRCMMKKREEKRTLYIFLLLVVFSLLVIGTMSEPDVILLFTRRAPLSWSQTTLGYYQGLENFLRSLMLFTVLPLCRKLRNTTLSLWGLASKVIGLVVLGLSKRTWQVFLVSVISMFQGFPLAVLRSIMSDMVSQDEHGRIFGLSAAVNSIGGLMASVIFNALYPATLDFFPGFSFIMAAGLCLVATLIMLWLHFVLKRLVLDDSMITKNVTGDTGDISKGDIQVETTHF
ncbi:lysosomal proton-coupled steroid conjugate and bile acid symporter SLC46A3-like [Haliotis asinina]|uniref:lysosomal proton-coupled steroid conjugate and bile acid symporter SLC46A3-like n=1 Tax=Haliotis asinina TaxID=109174 RepID=UPI003531F724